MIYKSCKSSQQVQVVIQSHRIRWGSRSFLVISNTLPVGGKNSRPSAVKAYCQLSVIG